MRQAVARRRRVLTGLMPAALLAAALAMATASAVDAAPLKAKPHAHTASAVQLTHGAHGHGPHHGAPSAPRSVHKLPAATRAPAPANAAAPQRISFDSNAGVAVTAGRPTQVGAVPLVAAPGLASSLGGILSLPQRNLFGDSGGGAGGGLAAAGPWQIVAAAEGLALLALAVTLVRRRRVSNRPVR